MASRRRILGKSFVDDDVLPQRPDWLSEASTKNKQRSVSAAVAPPRAEFPGAPIRSMPVSQCRRGSAMEHLAKEMVKEFKDDPRCQPAISARRTFRFATMCSGSEITGVAMNILHCVCASNGIEWKFEQAYACEIVEKKCDWILEVTQEEDCCVFEDFSVLSNVSHSAFQAWT